METRLALRRGACQKETRKFSVTTRTRRMNIARYTRTPQATERQRVRARTMAVMVTGYQIAASPPIPLTTATSIPKTEETAMTSTDEMA